MSAKDQSQLFVWASSCESIDSRVPSVLAIIETFLAAMLFVTIGFIRNDWTHFGLIAIVPFSLLRTDRSQSLGLAWGDKWMEFFSSRPKRKREIPKPWSRRKTIVVFLLYPFLYPFLIIFCVIVYGIWPFLIRIIATAATAIFRPLEAILGIPDNWKRICMCVDSAFPPEVLPGLHARERLKGPVGFTFVNFATANGSVLAGLLFGVPMLVVMFIPSLIFRWSLKATAGMNTTFIYLSRSAFSEGDANQQLRQFIRARVQLGWAVFVTLVLTLLPIYGNNIGYNLVTENASDNPFFRSVISFFLHRFPALNVGT